MELLFNRSGYFSHQEIIRHNSGGMRVPPQLTATIDEGLSNLLSLGTSYTPARKIPGFASFEPALQQALLTSFFSLFPLLFLSGSVSPIESMPVWLQVASEASPLRHGIAIVTGIFLKGAGLGELWPHALALGLVGAPLFTASWLLFRRQW